MNPFEKFSPVEKIGFTCGAFDLLHPGHIHFLMIARQQCNRLKVGLHTNPQTDRTHKNTPIQTMYERWLQLQALKCVDEIIPYDSEDDLSNLLATQELHVRFLGSDYINMMVTGQEICKTRNIELVYIPRLHTYSSTKLRQQVWTREWKQH